MIFSTNFLKSSKFLARYSLSTLYQKLKKPLKIGLFLLIFRLFLLSRHSYTSLCPIRTFRHTYILRFYNRFTQMDLSDSDDFYPIGFVLTRTDLSDIYNFCPIRFFLNTINFKIFKLFFKFYLIICREIS